MNNFAATITTTILPITNSSARRPPGSLPYVETLTPLEKVSGCDQLLFGLGNPLARKQVLRPGWHHDLDMEVIGLGRVGGFDVPRRAEAKLGPPMVMSSRRKAFSGFSPCRATKLPFFRVQKDPARIDDLEPFPLGALLCDRIEPLKRVGSFLGRP